MKNILALAALVLIGAGIYWMLQGRPESASLQETGKAAESVPEGAAVPADGTYAVLPEESRVEWAGKKPLLEGYINAGSIAVSSGTITVAQREATGEFALNMDTLSVSATPTKPGQESALEGHLKGQRWFDVASYPTATFAITGVAEREDSAETLMYDVTGDLTLKGQAHEVSFPATIYQDADGVLHASGSLEIDRTKWGITAGSASFFDNLADNAIDDMVALSFSLVATAE